MTITGSPEEGVPPQVGVTEIIISLESVAHVRWPVGITTASHQR